MWNGIKCRYYFYFLLLFVLLIIFIQYYPYKVDLMGIFFILIPKWFFSILKIRNTQIFVFILLFFSFTEVKTASLREKYNVKR